MPFLASLAIADGRLRRGSLAAGQVVVINGATGQLGGAAVLLALARGAARVVATGVNIQRAGEAEMDEMWSFVGKKGNQRWLWHAIGAPCKRHGGMS